MESFNLKNLPPMRYISRSVGPCYAGWNVRLPNGQCKYFSFYNRSETHALKCARAWRNDRLKDLDESTIARAFKVRINRRKSRIPAVRETVWVRNGKLYIYWSAHWRDADGTKHCCSFSVAKFGDAGAKRRALEFYKRNVSK